MVGKGTARLGLVGKGTARLGVGGQERLGVDRAVGEWIEQAGSGLVRQVRGVTRCQSYDWYVGNRMLKARDNECPICGETVDRTPVQEK